MLPLNYAAAGLRLHPYCTLAPRIGVLREFNFLARFQRLVARHLNL